MREEKRSGGEGSLFLRFLKQYAWKMKWSLLVCVVLVALNSNYQYMITYLTRLVVDEVLVVSSTPPPPPPKGAIAARDRMPEARRRPAVGSGHKMDMGVRIGVRPPEAGRKLFWLGVVYIGTLFLFNTMGRLAARRQIMVGQAMTGKLREDLHRKVLELSLSYHQAMSPGRLLSRIISDVEAARNEMMSLIVNGTQSFTMMVTGVVILIVTEWRMAVLMAVSMPIYWWMLRRQRPGIRHIQREQRHTNACMYGLVTQKIDAAKAIQSYGRELGEVLAFKRLTSVYFRDAVTVQFTFQKMNFQTWLIAHSMGCLIFLFGGWMVLNGEMSLGKMLFLQTTTLVLFQPVSTFTSLELVMQSLRVALGRCADVLDQVPEIAEQPNAVPFPAPLKRGIAIEHLSFAYPANTFAGADPKQAEFAQKRGGDLVLKDVSLFVPAGSWLCIMGSSGCGKSTLLHLLARLYEPTSGRIAYDGIDLDQIGFGSLRRYLGVVPQEAQIFSGSVRDNIAYGRPDASNTAIMEAASMAQMHDCIMEMPVKYETLIGEKGQSLSGGQRQRLSLARALLTKPDVLLLDDCTSALDANTERKIQETLETTLAGRTAVMVSQRVSMAIRCQQIAVLDNGVVSELGTHQELVARGGFYAKLFHEQTE